MKKIYLLSLGLSLTIVTVAQQNPATAAAVKTEYFSKSHTQKTLAWVLMGTGITTVVVGTVVTAAYLPVDILVGQSPSIFPIVAGLGLMAGSVPLFMASARNKRKGVTVSFKHEFVPQLQSRDIVKIPVPELSLALHF
jgi:uncharacterized membrane protein YfcA